ncbi:tissue factor pathway inhibitor 2 [Dipodomys spectabilis]|uniref:tissue factor pathway inhibitor 2 n=1 Tax=Dipodomys spectabilis TaxID=105255 RepID=UPI001C54771C|nr:tissue factor pathway inhibitor 2 [Dipodomys spectabilis]
MDPARPLGLLLLELLLMEVAPGLNAGAPTGNNANICLLPPDEGICRALLLRYYYNRHSQTCQTFSYGGCYGNANNFYTLEECEDACWRIEKVPLICRLEVSMSQCGQPREQYFFNLSSMACEKYMSGSCEHNQNQFPDEATCRNYCLPKKKTPSFCYSPKDEGLCSANVTRYYFNARYEVCEAFTYSGCGGNENNFYYMEDCERVCAQALEKDEKKMPRRFSARKRLNLLKIHSRKNSSKLVTVLAEDY